MAQTIGFTIRAAHAGDTVRIKQMEVESGLSAWALKDYGNEFERQHSICLVICNDTNKKAIGFLISRLVKNDTKTNFEFAEIYNIAIEGNYRGLGIGRALFDEFEKRLINMELTKIWLEVRKSNTGAVSFYRSMGFRSTGIRNGFYSNPNEDALLMEKILR